ncbi:MAG TPA: pitrilysin family protein [Opitutaceae bacterium]|nr:pitrilysin family protein [Opitutaceae bacterium]
MKILFRTLLPLLASAAVLLSAATAQIAQGVTRTKVHGIDVLAYKTGVKDVVYLRGSLPAGDDKSPANNTMVATLTGAMLDRGTAKQDKFAIAGQLEAVGASIDFSVGETVLSFTARCLSKDVPLVITLLAEQLREPAFSEEELTKLKQQIAGGLQRQLENTDFRAADEFNRSLYPVGHPNRHPSVEQQLADLKAATVEDLRKFHAEHYGPAHFTIVAAGDIDVGAVREQLTASFAGWTGGTAPLKAGRATPTDAAKEQTVFMPGKTSVSIVMGQTSGMRYGDPDYFALRTGTAILGSGFTGRLMANVRDKEGLTYGIGSTMANDVFNDGDWRLTATFAPNLLEQGIASTRRQLTAWYEKGVTAEELARRKENLVGSFKVGLATTDGLAQSLLLSVQRGKGPEWLDQYPEVIKGLTLDQVNGAIRKHLNPSEMYLIKAGTVPVPVASPAKK